MRSRTATARLFMVTMLFALVATACGAADDELVAETCTDDVPLVTWETFGRGFVTTYCQGCHASTAPNRQGAPGNIIFDTEADVVARKALVLATTTTAPATMPPNGGPSPLDRERLNIWLTCFAE